MLVSDTTLLLRKVIAENDTPFLYEKAGSFYKHFLIDEFQDISGFQWRNLQPLIANGLTEGYESLVVGDVKQSIYRWRGGDWRLLLTQLEQDLSPTLTISLDNNWRSRPHIVDFNNTFFDKAAAILVQHLSSELATLENLPLRKALLTQVQQLAQAYRDVHQNLPPQRTPHEQGYVNVTFVEEETPQEGVSSSWREVAKEQLISRIETLQQTGVPLRDMAILVRNNAEGRDIVQTLLARQQSSKATSQYRYDIISAESLYLSHSPWVNMLISALRYLDNPTDTLAHVTLWHLYQAYVLKSDIATSNDYWSVEKMTLPKLLVDHPQ
ncbi:MAG: UvrD-helicase domain-containing protein, partial [Bacteroidota bacterium]